MDKKAEYINESDDEEYEPTEQEIVGYAEFLGMDVNEDADLLYIAQEGVSIWPNSAAQSARSRAVEGLLQRERRDLLLKLSYRPGHLRPPA